jgi:hypothetical protein
MLSFNFEGCLYNKNCFFNKIWNFNYLKSIKFIINYLPIPIQAIKKGFLCKKHILSTIKNIILFHIVSKDLWNNKLPLNTSKNIKINSDKINTFNTHIQIVISIN